MRMLGPRSRLVLSPRIPSCFQLQPCSLIVAIMAARLTAKQRKVQQAELKLLLAVAKSTREGGYGTACWKAFLGEPHGPMRSQIWYQIWYHTSVQDLVSELVPYLVPDVVPDLMCHVCYQIWFQIWYQNWSQIWSQIW